MRCPSARGTRAPSTTRRAAGSSRTDATCASAEASAPAESAHREETVSGTVVELQARPRRGYAAGLQVVRRIVGSTGVVEEPISSELVLVDQELARRARAELPDPPWLLPAVAELQERTRAEPAVAPAASRSPADQASPAERGIDRPGGRRSRGNRAPGRRLRPAVARPVLRHDASVRQSAPAAPLRPPAVTDSSPRQSRSTRNRIEQRLRRRRSQTNARPRANARSPAL